MILSPEMKPPQKASALLLWGVLLTDLQEEEMAILKANSLRRKIHSVAGWTKVLNPEADYSRVALVRMSLMIEALKLAFKEVVDKDFRPKLELPDFGLPQEELFEILWLIYLWEEKGRKSDPKRSDEENFRLRVTTAHNHLRNFSGHSIAEQDVRMVVSRAQEQLLHLSQH